MRHKTSNAQQSASKMQGRKNSERTYVVARDINITYRLHRQGYLTVEIPEIEVWREQL